MARKSKTAPAPAPQVLQLALPDELTIYTVGELHPQWLQFLQSVPADGATAGQPVALQAARVEQVDAAGLQLLLSLERAVSARGAALRLQDASGPLRAGCEAIGLGAWLQRLETTAGASA